MELKNFLQQFHQTITTSSVNVFGKLRIVCMCVWPPGRQIRTLHNLMRSPLSTYASVTSTYVSAKGHSNYQTVSNQTKLEITITKIGTIL